MRRKRLERHLKAKHESHEFPYRPLRKYDPRYLVSASNGGVIASAYDMERFARAGMAIQLYCYFDY
jgi:alpha-beta hydrolase superfamily lysophospholipase